MSSLTTTTTEQLSTECARATTASTDTTPLSGNKRPASEIHPDSSPSPSKNYPDYSITKSSGDSVASGDDSIQWEAEGERILVEHARKTQEEDDKFEAEAQAELNHAAIDEFMLCGEEINKINNDEEGDADVPVAPPIFETVRYPYKPTTIASLRLVASALKIAASGTKKTLWDRICKCGNADITVEDETTFTFRRVKAAEGSVPMWIILTPEIVPEVAGIDMATGAQHGFCAPTNKDNARGATRSNFCRGSTGQIVGCDIRNGGGLFLYGTLALQA